MASTVTPFIALPFPARQHAEAAKIEAFTRDWAQRFHLVRSDAAAKVLALSRFGEFGAYAYPTASLPEAELVACWMAWLYFTDDQYEEGGYGSCARWTEVTEAIRGVLEPGLPTSPLADTPLIHALTDLSLRLDPLVSSAWKNRFTKHLLNTMAGALREIQLRAGGTPPSFSEYVALRRNACSALPCFDLIEVCTHSEIPAAAYHSAPFQEMILAGVDIVAWTNDLYSLEKEAACGIVSNIVLVLEQERELDRQQTWDMARTLINDRVNDLLAAEQRFPTVARTLQLDPSTVEAMGVCMACLRDWIAGSNHWHANGTTRYQQLVSGSQITFVEDLLDPAGS